MAEFLADDDAVVAAHKHTVYDLIANICHDGQPGMCVCMLKWFYVCMYNVCVCRARDISCSCAAEGEGVVIYHWCCTVTSGVIQGAGQWFELQDLHVQDLLPQMITLAEAYIQVSPH